MNILIVENDHLLRKALVLFFTAEGHNVLPAVDGQHALTLVQENRAPDLVICEEPMTTLSGPTFLLMLKRMFGKAQPRVIITSGPGEAGVPALFSNASYDYVVSKPIDFFTLKTLVEHISKE